MERERYQKLWEGRSLRASNFSYSLPPVKATGCKSDLSRVKRELGVISTGYS